MLADNECKASLRKSRSPKQTNATCNNIEVPEAISASLKVVNGLVDTDEVAKPNNQAILLESQPTNNAVEVIGKTNSIGTKERKLNTPRTEVEPALTVTANAICKNPESEIPNIDNQRKPGAKRFRRHSWTSDTDLHKDLRGFDELGIEHDDHSLNLRTSTKLCELTLDNVRMEWLNGIQSNIRKSRSDFMKNMTKLLDKIFPEVKPRNLLY